MRRSLHHGRAVRERLGECADHHRLSHLRRPRAVVPPLDVSRPEANLGGAAIALDAVDEVEPVVPGGDAPVDPGDRLDVAAAVGRLDVRHSIERLHRRHPSRHRAHEQHLRPTVARDPERRVPSLRGRAAAARERGGEDRESESAPHGRALERTAPLSVARTSPRCGPTHATAACVFPCVFTERPSTCSVAPSAAVFAPVSLRE